jgi:membrane protease subunit (stomatin/prohibitin family)
MSINKLERPESERELFIYRFPLLNNLIEMGSKLTVGPDEAAVFVKDGKVYDVFPKGEYTLNTTTMPLLTKGLSLKKNHGFSCDVYFVSLYAYQNLKWAMINSVVVRDNTFGSVAIKASGNFSFKVFNVSLFMKNMFGKITEFNDEDITSYLRNMIVNGIIDTLTNTRLTALDFYTNYPKFTLQNYREIVNRFNDHGLLLNKIEVEDVVIPEETEKLLKAKILEHANLSMDDIVNGKVQPNALVNQSNGLPINHPVNAGTLMTSEMKKMFNMVQDLTITCIHCGANIAKNFKYCPQCGKENRESIKECPKCHNIVAFQAKFCPDCGTELFDKDKVVICSNCGRIIKDHEHFCPDCGKPV